MNYPAIYPVLLSWAKMLTSPDGQTADDGIPFYRADGRWDQAVNVGEVRVTVERTVGLDFESHEYRDDEDDVLETAEGNRQLVVEFKITSHDEFAAETAEHRLGLLRNRAFRASSRATLRAVDLSVARVEPLVRLDAVDSNGHTLSVCTVDVLFNAYAYDSAGAESNSYIAIVIMSSDLHDVPPAAEWDEEVIQ